MRNYPEIYTVWAKFKKQFKYNSNYQVLSSFFIYTSSFKFDMNQSTEMWDT